MTVQHVNFLNTVNMVIKRDKASFFPKGLIP